MTQLGIIGIKSVVLAQDGHDGFAVLHLDGLQLNGDAETALAQQVHVEGVAEVTIAMAKPTITILVGLKSDGSKMGYDEVRVVAEAYKRALIGWAKGLSTEEFNGYVKEFKGNAGSASSRSAWAVYSS